MAEYIKKSDLESILRKLWKKDDGNNTKHDVCYNKALQEVQCEIDTLEVIDPYKEVDLKKEIYDAQKRFGDIDEMGGYRILIFDDEFRDVLRHFYELGLNTKKGE